MLCVFHSCLYVRLFYCMCCCDLLYVLSHLGCFLYLVSFTSCDYVFFYVCCLLFSFAVAIPRPLFLLVPLNFLSRVPAYSSSTCFCYYYPSNFSLGYQHNSFREQNQHFPLNFGATDNHGSIVSDRQSTRKLSE